MRLIDADSLKKFLTKLYEAGAPYDGIIELLDKQPTAYDVDKVVEQLENRVLDTTDSLTGIGAKWAYKGAINIVKVGGTND